MFWYSRHHVQCLLLLVIFGTSATAAPVPKQEVEKIGKAATAFLDVKPQAGSACCVHPDGYFLTNEHLVRTVKDNEPITLVTNVGLPSEKTWKARVVYADPKANLAVLRVEGKGTFAALDHGSQLLHMEVMTFGFSEDPGERGGRQRTLDVKARKVKGTTGRQGERQAELDSSFGLGNSGGPVLDMQGKLVGVLVAGHPRPDTRYVIPGDELVHFMFTPVARFKPPVVTRENMHEPALFEIQAFRPVPRLPSSDPKAQKGTQPAKQQNTEELTLELVLQYEGHPERKLAMKKTGDVFRVTAPPVHGPKSPLRLAASQGDDLLAGMVADCKLTIGGEPFMLSEARAIRVRPKSQVVFEDSSTQTGPIGGLEAVVVQSGNDKVKLKMDKVTELKVENSQPIDRIDYSILFNKGPLYQKRGSLTIQKHTSKVARAPLAHETVILPLPDQIDELAVGAGGRYLILHLPKLRKLAFFDTQSGKISRYLDVADDKVLIAAGLDKLVIYRPATNVLERWSLTTFEKELAVANPHGTINALVMGSASLGPLLISTGDPAATRGESALSFVDLRTLQKIEFKDVTTWRGRATSIHFKTYPKNLRISADGRVVAPGGSALLAIRGKKIVTLAVPMERGESAPGPDGQTVFSKDQVFTAAPGPLGTLTDESLEKHFKQLSKPAAHPGAIPEHLEQCFPATQGSYYFSLKDEFLNNPQIRKLSLSIRLPSEDTRPVVTFPRLEGLESLMKDLYIGPRLVDWHIHLMPDARLLVVIPASRDKLVLHRIDLDAELEKSGLEYLFVACRPPPTATKGGVFNYTPTVKSKKGSVKFRLNAGPKGMQIAADGRVTWTVPAAFADSSADVTLTISDSSGQQVMHDFRLSMEPVAGAKTTPSPNPLRPRGRGQGEEAQAGGDAPSPPRAKGEKVKSRAGPRPTIPTIQYSLREQDRKVKHLPGMVREVAIGGGGRYLVLHLPELYQLAIYDLTEARISHFIHAPDENARFAATLESLMVALPGKKVIERWNLKTGQREQSAALPFEGVVTRLQMGSASAGPLLAVVAIDTGQPIHHFQPELGNRMTYQINFLDIGSLKPVELGTAEQRQKLVSTHGGGVSANGKVFGRASKIAHTTEPYAFKLEGDTIKEYRGVAVHDYVLPDSQGQLLCTGREILTLDGKFPFGYEGRGGFVPVCEGGYATHWRSNPNRFSPASGGPTHASGGPRRHAPDPASTLSVHALRDTRPAIIVSGIEEPARNSRHDANAIALPSDQWVYFLPSHKVILTIPLTRDRLLIHPFDPEAVLEKSGTDYLFVTSKPPTTAKKGTTLNYQVAVKSNKGGLRYAIQSGPKGMTISESGKLTWQVPAALAEDAGVVVSVGDAVGQECLHRFELGLR